MRVRLGDIAARVGVSTATVSRVLNDRPGVSDTTRDEVLAALDALGYERPLWLRTKSTGLVGLIVPELDNPVFPLFAQAIEIALARQGYTPLLCTQVAGGVHEDEYVRTLVERGVSGIIFVSGIHAIADTARDRYTRLIDGGTPVVLVNGYLSGVDAPFVSNDDAASVDLAVDHLATLGHRRIGLALGPRRYTPVQRKIAAFHGAVRRHLGGGLRADEVESMIECTLFRVEGGAAAAESLLARGATALVCGSDLMALGAIRATRRRGLRVPQDVSVVGSDDSPMTEFTDPPLTTVRQPIQAMSESAVRALVDEITGAPVAHGEYLFRPELVVRESTAAARRGARRRVCPDQRARAEVSV